MRLLCGQRRRVERRIEKLIVDGTGEMRQMNDTVFLEGSYCGYAPIALGGCSRCEFVYWREIWLRPSDDSVEMLKMGKVHHSKGNTGGYDASFDQ